MDGVAISIIGRPRPLPGHDTPNPAHNTYTLKCEEPLKMMHLNIFRYFSLLLEGDARHAEEGLADFLSAFDVGDLEEALG